VGKGDRRTRRGKIYAGSFGKSRPKDPKAGKSKGAKAKSPAKSAAPVAKPAARTTTRRTAK
jgi:30S ribosomal protein S31